MNDQLQKLERLNELLEWFMDGGNTSENDIQEAVRKEIEEKIEAAIPYAKRKQSTEKPKASDIQVGGGHYKQFKIQPTEFCVANNIPFLEGNVIKYTLRHPFKNGKEDVLKARHYLDLLLEYKYGEDNEK